MPGFCDDVIYLVPRQLATLARLCALSHLDLQFIGVHKVVGCDSESTTRHLLDRAAAQIAVRVALEALLVLTAFSGVRHATEAIHCDRQRFVSFLAD